MLVRAVYPLYRIIGTAATGGIYAAPTSQPIKLASPQNRGRACPAPTALCLFVAIFRDDAVKRCLSAALPFENHENANQRSLHRKAAVACGINAFVVFP